MNYKKIFFVVSLFVVAGLFFGVNVPVAKALTSAEISALIQQLQQQIADLQRQLVQQQTTQAWCYTFNSNLGFANTGSNEVFQLHIVLQKENISYGSDDSNVYAEDTSAAVVQFQAKYGIRQTGYVGPLTRAKLNKLYGCGLTVTPPIVITPPVTTPTSSITVLSPNGGEKLATGNTYIISWKYTGILNKININLENWEGFGAGGPLTWGIASNISASAGQFSWTIPQDILPKINPGNYYKITIADAEKRGADDASDNYFSIVAATSTPITIPAPVVKKPFIAISSPSAGDNLVAGGSANVQWQANGITSGGEFQIFYHVDGYSPYWNFKSAVPLADSSSYSYKLPIPQQTGNASIFIGIGNINGQYTTSATIDNLNVVSAATSTTTPSITVLSPNGGETLTAGQSYPIKWNSQNIQEVSILLRTWEGNAINEIVRVKNTGSYTWNIPSYYSGKNLIWLKGYTETGKENSDADDTSDNYFSIVAAAAAPVACTDTDGGEDIYTKGTTNGWAAGDVTSIDTDFCSSSVNLVEWFCMPEFNGLKNTYRTNSNYTCSAGCSNGACLKPSVVGSLSLSLNAGSPSGTQVPGLNNEVYRFNVSAANEDIRLSKISVNFASQNGANLEYEIGAINLYNAADPATVIGTSYLVNNVVTFNFPSGLEPIALKSGANTFVLKADTTRADSATPVKFTITSSIEGVGVTSAKIISSTGSVDGLWLMFPSPVSSAYSGNLVLTSGWNYFSIPVKEEIAAQKIKDCAPGTWIYYFISDGGYYSLVGDGSMLGPGTGYAAVLGSGASSCSIPISGTPYNVKDLGIVVKANTTNALIGASSVSQTVDDIIGTCDKSLLITREGLSQQITTALNPLKSYWLKYTGSTDCRLGGSGVSSINMQDQLASISAAINKLIESAKELLKR